MKIVTNVNLENEYLNISLDHGSDLNYKTNEVISINVIPPAFLSTKGIVWHSTALFFLHMILINFAAFISVIFISSIPIDNWLYCYFAFMLILSGIFILSGKRFSNKIQLNTKNETHDLVLTKEPHWKLFYRNFKQQLSGTHFSELHTPAPKSIFVPLLYSLFLSFILFLAIEFLSTNAVILFGISSFISSLLLFRLTLEDGFTSVTISSNHILFSTNRGKYKNRPHKIEFNMIHNLGINKKRMIVVNRKTQKELSDKTGLEKFSHFNRIDHFFLRKGYVPIVKNVPLNMFQVESINEQLNKDAATVDFHVLK